MNFTANYIKIESGFMGQIVEWPEVITDGETIDECRDMLKDALEEMILAHKQLGYSIPIKKVYSEQMNLDMEYVG